MSRRERSGQRVGVNILRLPDEVLAAILDHASAQFPELRLVCKRFNCIVRLQVRKLRFCPTSAPMQNRLSGAERRRHHTCMGKLPHLFPRVEELELLSLTPPAELITGHSSGAAINQFLLRVASSWDIKSFRIVDENLLYISYTVGGQVLPTLVSKFSDTTSLEICLPTTSKSLEYLACLRSLLSLDISFCGSTAISVFREWPSGLARLQRVSVLFRDPEAAAMVPDSPLFASSQLRSLSLLNVQCPEPATLQALQRLSNLQQLQLSMNCAFSHQVALQHIAQLTNLSHLWLKCGADRESTYSHATPAWPHATLAWRALGGMPRLHTLDMFMESWAPALAPSGFPVLSNLTLRLFSIPIPVLPKHLTSLDVRIGGASCSMVALSSLKLMPQLKSLPNLRLLALHLGYLNQCDTPAIKELLALPRLQQLVLSARECEWEKEAGLQLLEQHADKLCWVAPPFSHHMDRLYAWPNGLMW